MLLVGRDNVRHVDRLEQFVLGASAGCWRRQKERPGGKAKNVGQQRELKNSDTSKYVAMLVICRSR